MRVLSRKRELMGERNLLNIVSFLLLITLGSFINPNEAYAKTIDKTFSINLSDCTNVENAYNGAKKYSLNEIYELNVGDTLNYTINITNDRGVLMMGVIGDYAVNPGDSNGLDLSGAGSDFYPGTTQTVKGRVTRNEATEADLWSKCDGYYEPDPFNPTTPALDSYTYDITIKWVDGGSKQGEQNKNQTVKEGRGKQNEEKKDDDDDDDDNKSSSGSSNVNPDALSAVLSGGTLGNGLSVGKQVQGPVAQMLFSSAKPAGWNEAFSFNITTNGKAEYSTKNGKLSMAIPASYQKTGRKFAILALDQSGNVLTFPDTDTSDTTITANLNTTAYAFDLIYIG